MPRLLRDLVDAITSAEPDMIIVGEHFTEADERSALALIDADILIVSEGGESRAERWLSLLYEHPKLKVLVLEQTGRTAQLYALRPHRTPLGEVSRAGLVDAIRNAVRNEVA
jgi:hypothetical protein